MKKPPPLRFHMPPEGVSNPTTPSCPLRQAERSPPEPGAGASAEEPRQGAGGRCQPPPPPTAPADVSVFPAAWKLAAFPPGSPPALPQTLRVAAPCQDPMSSAARWAGRGGRGGQSQIIGSRQLPKTLGFPSLSACIPSPAPQSPNNSVPVNPRSRIKASNSPPRGRRAMGGTGHRLSAAPRSCWACQENRAASCKLRVWGKTAA